MVWLKIFLQIAKRATVLLAVFASFFPASPGHAQFPRSRSNGPRPRAQPPESWPQGVALQFFPNAFAELGPRPDLSKKKPPHDDDSDDGSMPPAGGTSWSAIVSGETLVDEIKMMKLEIDKIVSKKRDFTGGGYLEARNHFSLIAASLAVVDVYDKDVRWKEAAARARDRFAAVASECNQGNDKTFAIATQAAEDLQKLVSGSRLIGAAANKVDWGRVAARSPLMMRLERAEKTLAEVSASETTFAKEPERFLHEAEIVALIGEFLQQPNCDDFSDDTYRDYASTMRDAAVQAAAAARKGDFATAQTAVSALRKSCDTCHADYR